MPSKVRKFTQARDTARGQANLLSNIKNLQDEIDDLRTYMHHQFGTNTDDMNSHLSSVNEQVAGLAIAVTCLTVLILFCICPVLCLLKRNQKNQRQKALLQS